MIKFHLTPNKNGVENFYWFLEEFPMPKKGLLVNQIRLKIAEVSASGYYRLPCLPMHTHTYRHAHIDIAMNTVKFGVRSLCI